MAFRYDTSFDNVTLNAEAQKAQKKLAHGNRIGDVEKSSRPDTPNLRAIASILKRRNVQPHYSNKRQLNSDQ